MDLRHVLIHVSMAISAMTDVQKSQKSKLRNAINKTAQVREQFKYLSNLNPHTPVAQKVVDKVVFRRFQGEGVKFFLNRTSLTPSDSVGFISRSCFESDGFMAFHHNILYK